MAKECIFQDCFVEEYKTVRDTVSCVVESLDIKLVITNSSVAAILLDHQCLSDGARTPNLARKVIRPNEIIGWEVNATVQRVYHD